MNHPRGACDVRQQFMPIHITHHGQCLTQDPCRPVGTLHRLANTLGLRQGVLRLGRTGHHVQQVLDIANGLIQPRFQRLNRHRLEHARLRAGQIRCTTRTHPAHQRPHALRGRPGQPLGNHPAHAHPNDMGSGNLQGIEHAQSVASHVLQAVGTLYRPAQPMFQAVPQQIGHPPIVKSARESGVPIVKTDDPKSSTAQPLQQRGWPGRELHAQPHDQQHGRSIPFAGVFDLKVDAVGLNLHAGVDQTASRLNTSRSGSDTAGAKA